MVQSNVPNLARALIIVSMLGFWVNFLMFQSLNAVTNSHNMSPANQGHHKLSRQFMTRLFQHNYRRTKETDDVMVVWDRLRSNLQAHVPPAPCQAEAGHLRGARAEAAPTTLQRRLSFANDFQAVHCPIPASKDEDYAIVATSTFQNPRTVFVNCLKWLLADNAREIWLILSNDFRERLEADINYGSRLRQWNQSAEHRLNLVLADDLWQALEMINVRSIQANAIVWRNADIAWRGTQDGMQAVLTLWLRNPSILFLRHGWWLNVADEADWRCQMIEPRTNTTIGPLMPLHQENVQDENTSVLVLPDLNGVLFPRNFLCVLNHPILDEIRRISSSSWDVSNLAVSLLVPNLHTGFAVYMDRRPSLVEHVPTHKGLETQPPFTSGIQDRVLQTVLAYLGGLPKLPVSTQVP